MKKYLPIEEHIDEIIMAEKKLVKNGHFIDDVILSQVYPFSFRMELALIDCIELKLMLCVNQSSKDSIRISLHAFENSSAVGLIRVDYNSGHKNPETKNEFLPAKFLPYIGEYINGSHVHYSVPRYKSLAWAVPIDDTNLIVKRISNSNKNDDFINAITNFAKELNITTEIKINQQLL